MTIGEGGQGLWRKRFLQLLLAVSPLIAYGLAFYFEWGHAQHYGYPVWMIDVDFRLALTFWAVGLFGAMGASGIVVMLLFMLPLDRLRSLFWFSARLLPPFIWLIIVWISFPREPAFGWWVIFGLGLVILAVVLWLFVVRCVIPYDGHLLERLDKWREMESKLESEEGPLVRGNIEDLLTGRPRPQETLYLGIFGLALLYFVILGVQEFGSARASLRTNYYTTKSESGELRVVLRRYGDRLVTSAVDSLSDRLTGGFETIPITNNRQWRQEDLGPLAGALGEE